MVTWSKPARDDLKSVFDYIAIDSKYYADKVVEITIKKTEIINDFPKVGRIVPEFSNENIREVFIYSYRLIYKISNSNVVIIHGARDLTSEEFQNLVY